jgi:MFS family permease
MTSSFGIVVSMGVLTAMGAGAGSFSVLIGAASHFACRRAHRGTASGVINAGSSFGQFVFAPIAAALIAGLGWMGAMWALALITLARVAAGPLMRRASGGRPR